jgi:hypothetical protein
VDYLFGGLRSPGEVLSGLIPRDTDGPIVALVGVGCARATWEEEEMQAVMHGPVVLAGSA